MTAWRTWMRFALRSTSSQRRPRTSPRRIPVWAATKYAFHALTRTYGDRPSPRVRDLPDLDLLIEDGLDPDRDLLARVQHVFDVRGTHPVPDHIPEPPSDWTQRYAALASELDVAATSLAAAIRLLRDFWERASQTPT